MVGHGLLLIRVLCGLSGLMCLTSHFVALLPTWQGNALRRHLQLHRCMTTQKIQRTEQKER